MGYTTPSTWVAGNVLTAAQLNQQLRDNVSFLANPPACRATHSTTQSLSNGTATALALNTETFDTDTMHDTVTNNTRLTVNTAGLYIVTGTFAIAAATDYTLIQAMLAVNGSIVHRNTSGTISISNQNPEMTVSMIYKLAAAQYIELFAIQYNGAAAARNASGQALAAAWIGLG